MPSLRWRLALAACAGALAGGGVALVAEELLPGERLLPTPLVAALAAAGSAAAAWGSAGSVASALRTVAQRLARFAAGDTGNGLYLPRADEVGELARVCNELGRVLRRQGREVAAERERFRTALDHMDAGVLLLDAGGRVILSNRAARRMLGLTAADHGRRHVEALRDFQLSEAIEAALTSGRSLKRELTLIGVGERFVDASLVVTGEEGRPGGVVAVLHDVTERRRQERLRAEFLANVSHELRTPVTAIQGFAETILEGGADTPERLRSFLGFIDREARRLGRLVEDLLDLVRLEERQVPLVRREVDLAELAQEVVARFRPEAERRRLRLEVEGRRPVYAFVDADRVEQVLVNLLDNAFKFTPPGGCVTVAVEAGEEGSVLLRVSDTGQGMPEEEVPLIFERFYRVEKGRSRRQGGTGLGLAIVRQIAEAHGGRVWARSAPGAGSTFYVALPRWAPATAPAPTPGGEEEKDGGSS